MAKPLLSPADRDRIIGMLTAAGESRVPALMHYALRSAYASGMSVRDLAKLTGQPRAVIRESVDPGSNSRLRSLMGGR